MLVRKRSCWALVVIQRKIEGVKHHVAPVTKFSLEIENYRVVSMNKLIEVLPLTEDCHVNLSVRMVLTCPGEILENQEDSYH